LKGREFNLCPFDFHPLSSFTSGNLLQLLPQIAQHLPGVVDGMTPGGQIPSSGNLLEAGLAFLKNRATTQP